MTRRGGVLWGLTLASALVMAGCSFDDDEEVAASVPEDIAEAGAIVVATDATFPPNQFELPRDFQGVQTNPLTGFEVELLEAVADELGLDVQWRFEGVGFADVLRLTNEGEVDMGSSSITVTDERLTGLNFVTFAAHATQWAAREPNALGVGPNNVCGQRVAVQKDTVHEADLKQRSFDCTEAGEEPVVIKEFLEQGEVTDAVLSGQANAFLTDSPGVQWAIRQAGGSVSGGTIVSGSLVQVGAPYNESVYGWAVPKDNEQLAEALLEGLNAVVEDGSYDDILEGWGLASSKLEQEAMEIVSN